MESEQTSAQVPAPEMVRPRDGRAIAGVSAALAIRFNLPVILVRIIFVVLAFTGGLGLFLYAAGWLLIRSEDEPDTPAQRLLAQVGSWQGWLGIGLLAVAAVIVLDRIPFIRGDLLWAVALVVIGFLLYKGQLRIPSPSPSDADPTRGASNMTTSSTIVGTGATPPILPTTATIPAVPPRPAEPRSILGRVTLAVALIAMGALAVLGNVSAQVDPFPRHYLALALLVLGLGLLVGSLWGRAKWLVLIGALMVPPLLVSPAAEFTSVQPNATVDPISFTDLDPAYQAGVGSLRLDLTALPWNGETIDLEVDVGMGELELSVPADIAVAGTAQIGVGELTTISQGESVGRSSGFGIDRTIHLPAVGGAAAGTINLDSSTGVGSVRIRQGDDFALFRPGPGTVVVGSGESLQPAYRVRRGDFTLDLSSFDSFDQGTSVAVGIGNLTVIVPEGATVVTEALTGSGHIDIDGQTTEGQGAKLEYVMGGDDEGQVIYLELKVGSGNITVERGARQ